MEINDKIEDILIRLGQIDVNLDTVLHLLNDNGQPGLLTRVNVVEKKQDICIKTREALEHSRKEDSIKSNKDLLLKIAIISLLVQIIGTVITNYI